MRALTALRVRTEKRPGRHSDGLGLALVIGSDGSRKWVLRVQTRGRRRDFGLGAAAAVTLAEARERAEIIRRQLRQGIDPVAERRKQREQIPTFEQAARCVHTEHLPSWKNDKHGGQWLATLERHVFRALGATPIDKIDGPMIRDVLLPIWLEIPETARRVRQRITTVLDWAHAKGFRISEAPRSIARGLPKQPRTVEHFESLDWQDVPAFIAELRTSSKAGNEVKAGLEFLILNASRSGEVRGARWGEFDLAAKQWNIPAQRMKAGAAHAVPLSVQAISILERMAALRG